MPRVQDDPYVNSKSSYNIKQKMFEQVIQIYSVLISYRDIIIY